MRNRKRRFNRKRTGRWLFIVTATLVTLGACAPDTAEWSPVEAPKKNRVDWVAFHHTIQFDARNVTLGDRAKAGLSRFVRRLGSGEGVRIMVAATADADGALVAGRREAAVTAYLRELGLRPRLAPAAPGRGVGKSAVVVTIGRYVVTTPRCPDWSKPAHKDFDNRVSSNFGCATETNLGLMVADPGTLLRGRPVGPADGEAQAKSIENYRKGEVEEAATEATTGGGGAGGMGK